MTTSADLRTFVLSSRSSATARGDSQNGLFSRGGAWYSSREETGLPGGTLERLDAILEEAGSPVRTGMTEGQFRGHFGEMNKELRLRPNAAR